MKKIIYILMLLPLVALVSCKDIMEVEPKYEKELLIKKLSSSDTLKKLDIRLLDFGSLKIRTVNSAYVSIMNNSNKDVVTIYNITSTNTSGLYSYTYTLPVTLLPGEDTELTQKIKVKFIADDLSFSFHYDTLILNNNPDFYIAVKAKVRY